MAKLSGLGVHEVMSPFENDTRDIEKKLARGSFRAEKSRNRILVIAIALTTILFTSLFTMGAGVLESTRQADKILSGGGGHANILDVDESAFEQIRAHPLILEAAYCRKLADQVDHPAFAKREVDFWYYDDLALKYRSVEPTRGHPPVAENELIMDSATLEDLGVPKEVGADINLHYTVGQQEFSRKFILAGWWESYPGVPYGTIIGSRAYAEAQADTLAGLNPGEKGGAGRTTALITFKETAHMNDNLTRVLEDCGFSTDVTDSNYINAGVNPQHHSLRRSSGLGTNLALFCALALFLTTGYLIIYNIFHMSILRDLRFYGLLKTIGTTERQIKAVVCRQARTLSLIGIPPGLLVGYLIGKGLLPGILAESGFSGAVATVSPSPLIFIAAGVFSFFTVGISAHKPANMAAHVSPIEALRYSDSDRIPIQKERRALSGNPIIKIARINVYRNQKRTLLVVLSLSLSIVLTNTVLNLAHNVDPVHAIKNMMNFDYRIGQSRLLDQYQVDPSSAVSLDFIRATENHLACAVGGCQYGGPAIYQSSTTRQTVNQLDNGFFSTQLYGLEDPLFSRLTLLDGSSDREKLNTGAYILEGVFVNTRDEIDEDSINHAVGDKVVLDYNGARREFTILGHVVANEANTYDWVGSAFFLPGDQFQYVTGDSQPMSYSFDVKDGTEMEMDAFLKTYTEEVDPTMNYQSRTTIMAGAADIQSIILTVGGTLAFIIGLIGTLNFINTLMTGMVTRQREFAILESIGMTGPQLKGVLYLEGLSYTFLSAATSLVLSLAASIYIVRPLSEQIWFMAYKLTLWPLVLIYPLLFAMGILIPRIAYHRLHHTDPVVSLKRSEYA